MANISGFAIKGATATPARAVLVAEMAAQPTIHVPVVPAKGAAVPATTAVFVTRNPKVADVFMDPVRGVPGTFTPKPVPPLRRTELTVPAAPTATPVDTDVFEGASDGKRYVLPRYAIAFDKIGLVEEPRIAIADRQGTPTLVVTLNETPSPAAAADTSELQHVLSVTLKYRVPVVDGGDMVQEILFPSVLLDATETVITAELPLTTPGQRQQILAALASLTASARLVVGRGITVGVPTGEHLADGAPGYRVRKLLLDWIPAPAPIVLSEAQRNRLGGGSGGVEPMIRHRVTFNGASHSYWQNPASPEHFYFLPDRFLLARAPDGGRAPLLRVRAAATAGDDAPRIAFEFQARPVIDADRIGAARPQLETAARQRGGTGPLALEIMPDPQPLLRLALPQNGAPSSTLTERAGADIDLETGLAHVETMGQDDFQVLYQALFGASLALLRGEIRAAMSGGNPEDIPLELRIDKTVGDTLDVTAGQATSEGLPYRLKNVIESPVRIDSLGAVAAVGDKRIPLKVVQLSAGQRLAVGESLDILLVAPEPIPSPGPDAILFDQSNITVEVDAKAIWNLAFDRTAAAQITRPIKVQAFPILFAGPEGSNDRVAAFNVTLEHGGSVTLTESKLEEMTTVRQPFEPLVNPDAKAPPIRYRTETIWGSGAIGVSELRETDASTVFPVKTMPR